MIAALLLAAAAVAAPLGSAEVLASLDERHPVIAAATQELARASALRLQALGAWDVKVKGKIENYDDDATAWDRSDVEFSLPTRLYGARIEGGYALGTGDLPSYYGEKKTSKQGELYAALSVPLLRGGWVDPERTQLAVARLEPAITRDRRGGPHAGGDRGCPGRPHRVGQMGRRPAKTPGGRGSVAGRQ